MGELDEIVLTAIEETVLEPKRLKRMTEALIARAGERNEALLGRLKKLDGEKRKARKQITELYDRIGAGDITFDATLKDHIEGLQQKHQSLTRQTAHLNAERSRPLEILSPERVGEFGRRSKPHSEVLAIASSRELTFRPWSARSSSPTTPSASKVRRPPSPIKRRRSPHTANWYHLLHSNGAPGEIRTPDPLRSRCSIQLSYGCAALRGERTRL